MSDNFVYERNPYVIFKTWFEEASAHEINDPNAMALSSVDPTGMPNVRVVLLKDWDEFGFVFYTNLESQKGREISASGKAAAVFHWKSLQRQVRVRGVTERVSNDEADAYFNSRSETSRLGAIASQQSRPLDSRETLMANVEKVREMYPDGNIPRPAHWHGTRIKPHYIEFWQDGDYRLHDRVIFTRSSLDEDWSSERWYP